MSSLWQFLDFSFLIYSEHPTPNAQCPILNSPGYSVWSPMWYISGASQNTIKKIHTKKKIFGSSKISVFQFSSSISTPVVGNAQFPGVFCLVANVVHWWGFPKQYKNFRLQKMIRQLQDLSFSIYSEHPTGHWWAMLNSPGPSVWSPMHCITLHW